MVYRKRLIYTEEMKSYIWAVVSQRLFKENQLVSRYRKNIVHNGFCKQLIQRDFFEYG